MNRRGEDPERESGKSSTANENNYKFTAALTLERTG